MKPSNTKLSAVESFDTILEMKYIGLARIPTVKHSFEENITHGRKNSPDLTVRVETTPFKKPMIRPESESA